MINIEIKIPAKELKEKLRIKDGKPADESLIVSRVLEQIPEPIDLSQIERDLKTVMVKDVVTPEDMIEVKDAIDDLEKEFEKKLEDIKKVVSSIPRGGRILSGRYVHTPMVNVFTGDGSTKSFILDKAPKDLDTIKAWGSDFPYILANGADNGFTVIGKVATLNDVVDAPSQDARLIFEYYI